MKQRLLFVLLALFTSIGWMKAEVKLTVASGTTGTLTFSKASGNDKLNIVISGKGIEQANVTSTSYKLTGKETLIQIDGSLASLTVNADIQSASISTASDLKTLTFSKKVGSISFADNDHTKLNSLTANGGGLSGIPTNLHKALAKNATVSLQNHENLHNVSDLADIEGVKYNLNGCQIWSWPNLSKATINYGTQNQLIDLGTVKANEWFDFYSALNNKISNYLGRGESPIAVSDLTVTWNGHTFETEKVTEGYDKTPRLSFRFWEGGKYVDGTFTAKAVIKNGPTYDNIKLIVNKATMPLTIIESEGGKLNATYTNGTPIASSAGIEEGKNIVLNPAPEKGYAFDKFEVKGLDVVDAEKHIYKVNIERDAKGFDVLSAKALFKAGTYTVTVKATGTDNGSFKIINLSNSNEEFTSTKNVSYGDKLKVVAIAAPGYRATVKIDNQAKELNNEGAYVFEVTKG